MATRRNKVALLVAVIAVVITTCVVIPMCWSSLEYHEMGFLRQKSTGTVDTDKIYTGGKYFTGPDYQMKAFKADTHFLNLNDIAIFTRDKLELDITVHLQYFIRPDELPLLHATYDVEYETVVWSSAMDAIKNSVPVFSTKEMFSKRNEVEAVIFKAIRERLGGTCCRPNCNEYAYACEPGCKQTCTDSDKGLNINVQLLQLTDVQIPDDVRAVYMQALLLDEKNLREQLLQNASVIRKLTDLEVREIKNEAREITQDATSEARRITLVANAQYSTTIDLARSTGLARLYATLNMTDQGYKTSFEYLRTLNSMPKAHLTVDFDQRIAGKL